MTRSLTGHVGEAKQVLADAGANGSTLIEMVDDLARSHRRMVADRAAVMQVLRDHGARPNGKRLAVAVDEALRLARRGDI